MANFFQDLMERTQVKKVRGELRLDNSFFDIGNAIKIPVQGTREAKVAFEERVKGGKEAKEKLGAFIGRQRLFREIGTAVTQPTIPSALGAAKRVLTQDIETERTRKALELTEQGFPKEKALAEAKRTEKQELLVRTSIMGMHIAKVPPGTKGLKLTMKEAESFKKMASQVKPELEADSAKIKFGQ